MPAGHVAALVGSPPSATAVLEVDEGYLGRLIEETRPRVVVLLNLSRDQLDRIAEVRMLVERWRAALGRLDPVGPGGHRNGGGGQRRRPDGGVGRVDRARGALGRGRPGVARRRGRAVRRAGAASSSSRRRLGTVTGATSPGRSATPGSRAPCW